jgi:hypothetical protein
VDDVYDCFQIYVDYVDRNIDEMPIDYVIKENVFPLQMMHAPLGELLDKIKRRELFFDIYLVKRWKKLGISFERKKTVRMSTLEIQNGGHVGLTGSISSNKRRRSG